LTFEQVFDGKCEEAWDEKKTAPMGIQIQTCFEILFFLNENVWFKNIAT
jgi:hypothetical protein